MRIPMIVLLTSLAVPGCIDFSPCVYHPLEVILFADAARGPAPLTVSFRAHGEGFYCGCCDGEDPTSIVQYAWDVGDDAIVELEGPDLTSCDLSFSEPGDYVLRVTVTDDAGDSASDVMKVEVLEPDVSGENPAF